MQVIKAPSRILRAKTKPVKKITPDDLKTIREMVKLTQSFKDPEGVGLAAPQIGISERFFIAKFGNTFQAFFNPQITFFGKRQKKFLEGCLSIPDYYGEVTRPALVKVKYLDKEGRQVSARLTGLSAMIFQHEYDHLQGRLFIDYVMEQKSRLFKVVGRDQAGAEIFEEVRL